MKPSKPPTEISRVPLWLSDYTDVRTLPSGEAAGLTQFLFTVGLCVGLSDSGYRVRYCFIRRDEAESALRVWDGTDDPPGPWIKAKSATENRPNTFRGIPVVEARS